MRTMNKGLDYPGDELKRWSVNAYEKLVQYSQDAAIEILSITGSSIKDLAKENEGDRIRVWDTKTGIGREIVVYWPDFSSDMSSGCQAKIVSTPFLREE